MHLLVVCICYMVVYKAKSRKSKTEVYGLEFIHEKLVFQVLFLS